MKHTLPKQTIILLISIISYGVLSQNSLAVQPLSESDLGSVSAVSGNNILNIYGASAAGLRIDEDISESDTAGQDKLSVETFKEGESTTDFANKQIRDIEDSSVATSSVSEDGRVDEGSILHAIESSSLKVGKATGFTTNSEIQYKEGNVHHEMRELGNGGVAISRDLSIDLLKIEDLRGDHYDESRSAGSIYLSNWHSQGDTRMITHNR